MMIFKRLVCWMLGHKPRTVYFAHEKNRAAPLKVCARCERPMKIRMEGCE